MGEVVILLIGKRSEVYSNVTLDPRTHHRSAIFITYNWAEGLTDFNQDFKINFIIRPELDLL